MTIRVQSEAFDLGAEVAAMSQGRTDIGAMPASSAWRAISTRQPACRR